MGRGVPLADHFTILGRVVLTREPSDPEGEPHCRLHIGFNVAFHKVINTCQVRGCVHHEIPRAQPTIERFFFDEAESDGIRVNPIEITIYQVHTIKY